MLTRLLAAVAVVLLLAGVWLWFDNPDIDGTSRGDDYTCLAPWDTVINSADNFPGGEPPPDGDDIAARCREAGRERFTLAVASGAGGGLLSAVAVGTQLVARRRRSSR